VDKSKSTIKKRQAKSIVGKRGPCREEKTFQFEEEGKLPRNGHANGERDSNTIPGPTDDNRKQSFKRKGGEREKPGNGKNMDQSNSSYPQEPTGPGRYIT